MALQMYDLCGEELDRRFSPYCWLVKLVAAHKGLAVDTVPLPFTDKESIAFADWKQLPVLTDGDTTVVDSWQIVHHLEQAYPDTPVAASPDALGQALLIKLIVEHTVMGPVLRSVILDIHNLLAPADAAYFRETREARFGSTLEDLQAGRESHRQTLQAVLGPFRATLKRQTWLSGESPGLADLLLFATFMWARSVSSFQLLNADDPVYVWRDAMLARYASVTEHAKGFAFSDAGMAS
ncbi:MAG: glutathione S-transferase N-terminal domain-containing protein [Pseudomonadota bacterium]